MRQACAETNLRWTLSRMRRFADRKHAFVNATAEFAARVVGSRGSFDAGRFRTRKLPPRPGPYFRGSRRGLLTA